MKSHIFENHRIPNFLSRDPDGSSLKRKRSPPPSQHLQHYHPHDAVFLQSAAAQGASTQERGETVPKDLNAKFSRPANAARERTLSNQAEEPSGAQASDMVNLS